jgi:hypothetical protein
MVLIAPNTQIWFPSSTTDVVRMHSLLELLVDMFSQGVGANRAKSSFMRWVDRIVLSGLAIMIALVLFHLYGNS